MLVYAIARETVNAVILYILGVTGWLIGEKLRLPTPSILGGIFLVGGLRIADIGLPLLHDNFIALIQILLGIMVGARFDKQAVESIKFLSLPAGLISFWALSITLVFGVVIAFISPLDITTGILSSSIGGLPEMTILAHDTRADPVIVALFQIVRIFITLFLFPFLIKYYNSSSLANINNTTDSTTNDTASNPASNPARSQNPGYLILTLLLAGVIGWGFIYVGVPAGGLVGSMLFIMGAQYLELPFLEVPPAKTFDWCLVGIGLMVTNQIEPDTLRLIFSLELAIPLVVSLVLTYASSIGMTFILYKLTRWNPMLCFLSSAPGGIATFTALAVNYGYDPVKVSLLHLARIITLKLTIPFLFMLFYY